MRPLVLIFASLLYFQLISLVSAQDLDNYYTIQEFNKADLDYGTYQIVGYVVKSYSCPTCSVGFKCSPCHADYIVISEDKKIVKDEAAGEKDLIIFVENAKKFRLKSKYMFLIKTLNVKTLDQSAHNAQLIYSERLE